MYLLILRVCLCLAKSVSDVCSAQISISRPPTLPFTNGENTTSWNFTLYQNLFGEKAGYLRTRKFERSLVSMTTICFPPPAVCFVSISITPDFEKSEDAHWDTFSVAYSKNFTSSEGWCLRNLLEKLYTCSKQNILLDMYYIYIQYTKYTLIIYIY